MPTLEKLRLLTGMDRCQLMLLKYDRGETCLYHVDRMPRWDLINNPNDTIPDDLDDFDNHQYIRMLIMPRDRAPGQYMQFGDIMLNDWKAGDAFYYRGVEVYHSAGVCGYEPRLAIRITGLRTPKFDQFISCKDHYL